MIIYIAGDHRGFYLKETLKDALKKDDYEVVDVGNPVSADDDDYPDFATAVAEKVAKGGVAARGIVICGSGFGVDITANKFNGIRSALAMSADHIRAGRHDDNVNVLSLASDFIEPKQALEITRAFLSTAYDVQDRYSRRLDKIAKIEQGEKAK